MRDGRLSGVIARELTGPRIASGQHSRKDNYHS